MGGIENMTEQEYNDRQLARTLAKLYYAMGIDKIPIVLNSQQYKYFVEEWNNLNEKTEE